jgi:hypothetical protein
VGNTLGDRLDEGVHMCLFYRFSLLFGSHGCFTS